MLLKILLGILVVAAVLAGAIAYAAFRLPQPIKIDMSGNRRALLYRLSGGPHPTLIVLHSYSGDALTTAKYSGFLQAALPRGFNIVFPDAVGHEWQDSPEESPAHANDVAMRLLMINGDADDVLPYAGGDVGDPGGFFRSVASVVETASLFARANGCDAGGEPRRTSLRDGKRRLERIDWDCPPNASTGVVKVIGGGHDVLGWRNPIEAFLGFPPRGPATAAAIVDRFADARDRARLVRLPSDRPP